MAQQQLTIAPAVPKVIHPTYISPQQQKLLDAFADDDYFAVADALLEIETTTAPNPGKSRLLIVDHANTVREIVLLMAMRNPNVLRAIWRNELPQRLHGDLVNEFRIPGGGTGVDEEPVVYLNFVAAGDGRGVLIDDYEFFLTALDITAGVYPAWNASAAEKQASQDQRTAFNAEYPHLNTKQAMINAIELAFKVWGKPSKDDFFKGKDLRILRDNVQEFTKHHREVVLPAARAAGLGHIALPGECGLAIKGYDRCKDHKSLADGPVLFRLFTLVSRVLFKKRAFRLYQLYLFEIFAENTVDIGESIGSLFTNAYPKAGGTNTEQAGISQSKFQTLSLGKWKVIAHRIERLNGKPLQRLENNVRRVKKLYEDRYNAAKAMEEEMNLRGQMQQELDHLSRAMEDVERLIPIIQDRFDIVQDHLNDLARRRAEDAEQEQAIKQADQALEALRQSVSVAGAAAPFIPGTQPDRDPGADESLLTEEEAEAKRIDDAGDQALIMFHAALFGPQQ
ncbi:unnamed protein product [Zymoseptoria tritici ST99CH_3D7]|uniref:Uncharacterized protein n=1 Tax=Zymoseptoria tritici (strain ST99CH_3D7) TaxID=1276538 RepID=A0A1X7S565_ZYMT9|nr:unnamed protein product [Zymoseptoria tritici ST99CH_3D7]